MITQIVIQTIKPELTKKNEKKSLINKEDNDEEEEEQHSLTKQRGKDRLTEQNHHGEDESNVPQTPVHWILNQQQMLSQPQGSQYSSGVEGVKNVREESSSTVHF